MSATRIYVASSWRNEHQPNVVRTLRAVGHLVYDFRHPEPGDDGFRWTEVDPSYQQWTFMQFVRGLEHEVASKGFWLDMNALMWCDVCVLVLPSGRSAHLEAGHAIGAGKPTIVYCPPGAALEPELMYKMCSLLTQSLASVAHWIETQVSSGLRRRYDEV